jgi:formamidopyrimidine-DNA glycosylase
VPELPDVEGTRREMERRLSGRTVLRVEVLDPGIVHGTTPSALAQALVGRRFATPGRRGKWLQLPTDGPTVLVHHGMTGRTYVATDGQGHPYDRLVVDLDQGQLRYADLRKLRGVWLAHDEAEVERVIGPLGPDALHLTTEALARQLLGRRGRLKPTLTDQKVLAGLGNMLSDEICWRARLHPGLQVTSLDPADIRRLNRAMQQVLITAVRHGCIPHLRGWLTRVRDQAHPVCPRCTTPLQHSRINGRATIFCPLEQTLAERAGPSTDMSRRSLAAGSPGT